MGYIRFLLATVVMFGHIGGATVFMTGGSAVEAFFVISGFYMALTLEAHYQGRGAVWKFYLSRFTRLYPLYLITLAATIVTHHVASRLGWHINSTRIFDYFEKPQDALQRFAIGSLLLQDLTSVDFARHLALPVRRPGP